MWLGVGELATWARDREGVTENEDREVGWGPETWKAWMSGQGACSLSCYYWGTMGSFWAGKWCGQMGTLYITCLISLIMCFLWAKPWVGSWERKERVRHGSHPPTTLPTTYTSTPPPTFLPLSQGLVGTYEFILSCAEGTLRQRVVKTTRRVLVSQCISSVRIWLS